MDYEQLKAFTNNEIEPYLQHIEMWQCIMAFGIKPFKDSDLLFSKMKDSGYEWDSKKKELIKTEQV